MSEEKPTPSVASPSAASRSGRKGGATPSGKPRSLKRTATRLLGASALLAVGYVTLPWWIGGLPTPVQGPASQMLPAAMTARGGAQGADVAALVAEVEELRAGLKATRGALNETQGRVQALEKMAKAGAVSEVAGGAPLGAAAAIAVGEPAPDAMTALRRDVEALAASRAPSSSVLALADRVSAAEGRLQKLSARQDHAIAFLLAVAQLRQAVDSGRAFSDELKVVKAVAPPTVDVETLAGGFAPAAVMGIWTEPQLQQSFAALSSQAVRASMLPESGGTVFGATVDRLLSIVSIRRIDGAAVGSGAPAVISRSEMLLNTGNLAATVMELSKLHGGAETVMAPWIEQAQHRLAANQGVANLTGEALAALVAMQREGDGSAVPAGAAPVEPSPSSAPNVPPSSDLR